MHTPPLIKLRNAILFTIGCFSCYQLTGHQFSWTCKLWHSRRMNSLQMILFLMVLLCSTFLKSKAEVDKYGPLNVKSEPEAALKAEKLDRKPSKLTWYLADKEEDCRTQPELELVCTNIGRSSCLGLQFYCMICSWEWESQASPVKRMKTNFVSVVGLLRRERNRVGGE